MDFDKVGPQISTSITNEEEMVMNDKNLELQVVTAGGKIRCVYLDDFRITGGKPYVSEGSNTVFTGKVAIKDLQEIINRHK